MEEGKKVGTEEMRRKKGMEVGVKCTEKEERDKGRKS